MDENTPKSESFDESQSLQVIHAMIRVSQNKLKNDGILFIVWGWISFINYVLPYLMSKIYVPFQIRHVLEFVENYDYFLGLAFTIYYILKHRRKVQTYIGISLRYVWVSLVAAMMLVNLILFNILNEANFKLQHPIFMVFIAFATVVTGGILRYRLLIIGGIIFGMLAYAASYLELKNQLLVEALAWLIAFIIPGHILYSKRKS